jgi:glycosyltransferase involved in cell wall biosynthesis
LSVSVVIPTRGRVACLERLLRVLTEQTRRPEQVCIVCDDDGSVDVSALESAGMTATVLRSGGRGSAAARNVGLKNSDGDIIFCLDDDVIPPADFIERLAALYVADTAGVVDGIGATYCETRAGWRWRLWTTLADASGQGRWGPRVRAARYEPLSPELAGGLVPADMLPGGAISLRRAVAEWARFDERLGGYAFGEDREFVYRIGRRARLFRAVGARVIHDPPDSGRGDWEQRGRHYVTNLLHVARCGTEGGAGLWMLVVLDLLAATGQHLLWAAVTVRKHNAQFAAGAVGAMGREIGRWLKNL